MKLLAIAVILASAVASCAMVTNDPTKCQFSSHNKLNNTEEICSHSTAHLFSKLPQATGMILPKPDGEWLYGSDN